MSDIHMLKIKKPDMSCYPFRRKGLYLAIVIPYLVVLAWAFIYLLVKEGIGMRAVGGKRRIIRYVPAFMYLALYAGMCYFQAYCCACQECPYVGEFCPAIAGIYPANILANAKYSKNEVVKSERAFKKNATLAGICWGGIMVLPLYWLWKRSAILAVGYALAHAVYYLFQGLAICPACAIRETCPGGTLQKIVLKGYE